MTDTINVIVSTRRSTAASAMRGMSAGASATSSAYAEQRPGLRPARPRPARAARLRPRTGASSVLPLAPSAVRTATSRRRALPRASSRLATLAQATSSTRPTAVSSTSSAGRTGPNTTVDSGSTKTPRARFSGYARSRSAAIAASSSCVAATLPRIRATMKIGCVERGIVCGVSWSGSQTSTRGARAAVGERARVVGGRQDLEDAEVGAAAA